jgi:integral membrane protein (TIGR01906 family)
MMKVAGTIVRWLFILCLPLLLLTAGLRLPASSAWLYYSLFNKYQVGTTTGLDAGALKAAAHGMVGYFNSGDEYIGLTVIKDGQPFALFNQREIVHLKDVKGLFQLDLRVFQVTAAFALVYAICGVVGGRRRRAPLAKAALYGALLTLGLMLVMGVGMLFDFDSLLWRFHLVSFANDFWLLDPTRDYLIMLITHGFMYDAAFIVAGATAAAALVVGGVGGGYLFYLRKQPVLNSDAGH